jgi:DNA-binding transcriptional ArsR family regulator
MVACSSNHGGQAGDFEASILSDANEARLKRARRGSHEAEDMPGKMLNVMVKSHPLDAMFRALSDPTRRAIVERLTRGDASVGELSEPFDMSLPAISKHLTVLERAGVVERVKEGRTRRCHLVDGQMRDALEWIATYGRFWEGQLDSLERFLAESKGQRGG